MTDIIDDIFKGANEDEGSNRGEWLKAGHRYHLRIVCCDFGTVRKGGNNFIPTFEVVSSTDPGCPAGSKRVWYQKIGVTDEARKTARRSMLDFVIAALGKDRDADREEIDAKIRPVAESLLTKVCRKENRLMLAGKEVYCEVTEKPLKSNPAAKFSLHTFSPAKPAAQ